MSVIVGRQELFTFLMCFFDVCVRFAIERLKAVSIEFHVFFMRLYVGAPVLLLFASVSELVMYAPRWSAVMETSTQCPIVTRDTCGVKNKEVH